MAIDRKMATFAPSAELALRRYGSPSLVSEYDSCLDHDQQQLLLAELFTATRDKLIRTNISALSHGSLSGLDSGCPLIRVLLEMGVPLRSIAKDGLDSCLAFMRSWGSIPTDQHIYQLNVFRAKQQDVYYGSCDGGVRMMFSSRTVVKQEDRSAEWSNLRKLSFDELPLFKVAQGCYAVGVVIGEAIVQVVGGRALLQDDAGHLLILYFYNVLPACLRGIHAEPLLRIKFPMGATIRIAEPFYKILRDGTRGVRIDDPSEIEVQSKQITSSLSEEELNSLKEMGNKYALEGQFDAAIEMYFAALRQSEGFVAIVLSNRSQAYIKLQQWAPALCDAAASLTIRPSCKKTWARYKLALSSLTTTSVNDATETTTQKMFRAIVDNLLPPTTKSACANVDIGIGSVHKKAGNDAFQLCEFETAINHYSEALLADGGTTRALLSNWASCALETECLMDVIAAASASIRIALDQKALYRLAKAFALLGEYQLATSVASLQKLKSATFQALLDESKKIQRLLCGGRILPHDLSLLKRSSTLANWIGPVEAYLTESIGRGLRATRDITAGEVLLIQRPIVFAQERVRRDASMLLSTAGNNMDHGSTAILKSQLVHRIQRDCALHLIVGRLSSGGTSDPLTPLQDLTLHLNMCSALLPGHFEYQDSTVGKMTAHCIDKIVDINVFGGTTGNKLDTSSLLAPAVCIMNHSNNPSAVFAPVKDRGNPVRIIIANRNIPKGEEIFLRYHTDKDVLSRKWGIKS